MSIVDITSKQQYLDLIKNQGLNNTITHVIVNFGAPWCRACINMMDEYKKLPKKYPTIVFAKFNVDENDDLANFAGDEGILSLPTFKFYDTKKDMIFSPLCSSNINDLIKKIDETLIPFDFDSELTKEYTEN